MKGPPGYDIGDGNCLSMLKCIYGLVQAPRQYYMLCHEVFQKAGMKQFLTGECLFTRYVSNIIGSPSLTNEDLLVKGKFLKMEILHMQMHVYRLCSHPVAVMILVMYIDNNGIRYNWSGCKNVRSLSSKMVALICNVKESSIGILSVRYTYDKITVVIGCNQQAYIDRLLVKYGMKMLMLASCR